MPAPGASPDRARLRGTLVAVSLIIFAVQVDFFALNLALPDMSRDLDVSVTELQWVLSAYMIAVACSFPAGGRLGDIFGRRRVVMIGVALFGLSSLVGGFADSEGVLIGARIVQGVGGATMWAAGIATLTNTFPPERLQRAIGIAYGVGGLGAAVGPLVGGVLTDLVSWRLVLWVNVPVAILVLAFMFLSVEESRDDSVPRKVDIPGFVLITGGLFLATYGVDSAQFDGWASLRVIGPIVLGILAIVAFVFVERRVQFPLIDLQLFRNRAYVSVSLAGSVAQLPWVGTIFLTAIYLQDVRDLSPAEAGLVFVPLSAGSAVAGYYSGRLERFLPQWVLLVAMIVGGVGVLGAGLTEEWPAYVVALLIAGTGLGLTFAYATVVTQAVVQPQQAGAASGVTMTLIVSFAAISVAVVSTLLALGTDSSPLTSADTDSVINDLLVGLGIISIVLGLLMPFVARLKRSDLAGAAG